MFRNSQIKLKKQEALSYGSLAELVRQVSPGKVLRWYVAQSTTEELIVEVTTYEDFNEQRNLPSQRPIYPGKNAVLNIIPTGIGCSIGGFAGDAAPAANLLAETTDYLITNPNTVNASNFVNLQNRNILYTD